MKRVMLFATVQVVILLGWAGYHEHIRATAPTFRIPLRPVDPFDVVRGRYFILNPEDARIAVGSTGPLLTKQDVDAFLAAGSPAGIALVGFCPAGAHYRICGLRRPGDRSLPGPARYWSRAFVTVQGPEVQVDLGLDRFFLPNRATLPGPENQPGWELEVSYREGQTLLPRRLWFANEPVDVGG